MIWLFIHIAFLTGYRNRIGALFTWWFAFTRDIRRERTFTTQQIETLRDVYTLPLGPDISIAPESAPDGLPAAAPEPVTGMTPAADQSPANSPGESAQAAETPDKPSSRSAAGP